MRGCTIECVNTDQTVTEWHRIAREVRRDALEIIYHSKAGHPGASLSIVELLVGLYFGVMRIRPEKPEWEQRDRFILSKGHATAALYATLARRGYFPGMRP